MTCRLLHVQSDAVLFVGSGLKKRGSQRSHSVEFDKENKKQATSIVSFNLGSEDVDSNKDIVDATASINVSSDDHTSEIIKRPAPSTPVVSNFGAKPIQQSFKTVAQKGELDKGEFLYSVSCTMSQEWCCHLRL